MTDAAPEPEVVDDGVVDDGVLDEGVLDEGVLDGGVLEGEVTDEEVLTATGVPAVDAALARLEGLEERPVEEHPEVFEAVHGALRAALGSDGS